MSFIWAVAAFVGVGIFPLVQGIPVAKTIIHNLKNKATRTSDKQQPASDAASPTESSTPASPNESKTKITQSHTDSNYIA